MKEKTMIQKNKITLLISSAIILLPALAGLLMWDILPEHLSTHWGINGKADGWSMKGFAVLGLPLIMLAIHWFCILLTAKDPKASEQSDKVLGMVLWIIPMVSLIVNGTIYAVALEDSFPLDIPVRIMLALIFILLGNYMPKCKQNHIIGVRVTWTLNDEENWNKTHRFTGKLWVFGGFVLLIFLFIPFENFIYFFLTIVLLLSLAPILYSYLYHKKQVKEGTAATTTTENNAQETKFTKITLIVSAVIILGSIVLITTGDIRIQYEDTSFTLKASYWDDAYINYSDIDSLEYRTQDEPGERTFGFGSLKLQMGKFKNKEFGSYTRYSYTKCDSCIVLSIDDKTLVINGEDEESTRNIYQQLQERMKK